MEHSDSSFANYADLKLKSTHFSISFIKIGFWQKHSHFGGNLIGKFHYNWQKIMWEIVENGVKNRIVIPWNRICGIRASQPQICRSIIELELDHPPDFEIEKVSQSRKREKPEPVPDFTQEQASCCRRHWIEVPEEDFDKHYEKILVCCPRLKSISGGSLPFSNSLLFQWSPPLSDLTNSTSTAHNSSFLGIESLKCHSSGSALNCPRCASFINSLGSTVSLASSSTIVGNSPSVGGDVMTNSTPSTFVSPSEFHGSMIGITSTMSSPYIGSGVNIITSSSFVPPFESHGLTMSVTNPSGHPSNSLNSSYSITNSSHLGIGITGSTYLDGNSSQIGNVMNTTTAPPTLVSPFWWITSVTGYPINFSPYASNSLNTATPSNVAWCFDPLASTVSITSSSTSPSSPVESRIGSNRSFTNSSSLVSTSSVASSTLPPSTMGPVSPLGVMQSSSSVWPSQSLESASMTPISVAGHEPFHLNSIDGINDYENLFWTSPLQDHMEVGGATNEDQTQEGLKISLRTCFSTEEIEKFLLDDNVDHVFALPEQYNIENNTVDSTASIDGAQSSEFSDSWLSQPATSALADKEIHESWLNFLGSESPCRTLLDDPHVHDSMGGDWSF